MSGQAPIQNPPAKPRPPFRVLRRHVKPPPGLRTAHYCDRIFSTRFHTEHLAPILAEMNEAYLTRLSANEPAWARWVVIRGHLILAAAILKHPVVGFVRGMWGSS